MNYTLCQGDLWEAKVQLKAFLKFDVPVFSFPEKNLSASIRKETRRTSEKDWISWEKGKKAFILVIQWI
jgi:hypothetical protein